MRLLHNSGVSNQGDARVIPQVKASKLQTLPFPDLRKNKLLQAQLVSDCKALIEAKHKAATAFLERQKDYYAQRYVELNTRINTTVFELYGLSDEEVALVENAFTSA